MSQRSQRVTEKQLSDGYVAVSFDGSVVLVMHEERGFLNPTLLCQRAGKTVPQYDGLNRKKNLMRALAMYSEELRFEVEQRAYQNELIAGWYMHPTLLLDLTMWLSPDAFAMVAIVVGDIFHQKGRNLKLSNLMQCGKLPTYEPVETNPSKRRIRFTKHELVVDQRGWFDASRFCIAYNRTIPTENNHKTLYDFGRSVDTSQFIDYLRKKGLFGEKYYHPLLFLRLAAWIDKRHFLKCVRIVFCADDNILDALFRKTIAAAVNCWMAPQPAASQPSTSCALPMLSGIQCENQVMDSDKISRKEHQEKVAELERQLECERQKIATIRASLTTVLEENLNL